MPRSQLSPATVICADARFVTGVPSWRTRRHLNGTACAALTTLRTDGLSTGDVKPRKSHVVTVRVDPAPTVLVAPSTVTETAGPLMAATENAPSAAAVTFAVVPALSVTTVAPPPRTTSAVPAL